MGFFKDWAANVSEHKHLQQELKIIFAKRGINFMHLHPEVTKCLIGIARDADAEQSITQFDKLVETIQTCTPGISEQETAQQLITAAKAINAMAR